MDRLLALCPEVAVDLNFSLDGLADTHDAIRGVPNNFARTLATIKEAEKRYRGMRRLRQNVVSVITRENYRELVALGLYLLESADLDGHYFEVVRGPMPACMFATMYYLGNLRLQFQLQEWCLERPKQWPMPCTAGRTAIVVDHNGAFRACELRGILGNLRDFEFNLSRAFDSEALRREIEQIPRANCWCTHSCFIHESSRFSPRVQLFHIPWGYLRQRIARRPELSARELEKFKALEPA